MYIRRELHQEACTSATLLITDLLSPLGLQVGELGGLGFTLPSILGELPRPPKGSRK